jgi:hypothetical protein
MPLLNYRFIVNIFNIIKVNPMMLSARAIYHKLRFLEQVDVATSALYRQLAQDILANPDVKLPMRQAIANRLHHANHELEMQTVSANDSY